MKRGLIVTISREYCSGGDELAKLLADRLGYKYYDREIISMASEKSGIHEDHFETKNQKPTNSLLYSVVMGMYSAQGSFVRYDDILTDDKIFSIQADIIREMSQNGNCVFVGRCSDYILRKNENCVSIFIHTSMEKRIQNVMNEQNVNESEAKKIISKADKKRRSYYNYYTNRQWADLTNYDLCINLSKISELKAVEVIVDFMSSI